MKVTDKSSTMMNYLKRRFSSGDLQNEHDEGDMTLPPLADSHTHIQPMRQSMRENKSSTYTSAPSSPTRNVSFANQFFNAARGVMNQAMQQIPHQQMGTTSSFSHSIQYKDQQANLVKEKCKLLLVIDDPHTDW